MVKNLLFVITQATCDGKPCAMKTMKDKFLSTHWESFCHEIELAISLPQHPNIVTVYTGRSFAKPQSIDRQNIPFYCMGEYLLHSNLIPEEVMKTSLKDYLRGPQLSISIILKILLDISMGMNFLHTMKISHR